MAGLKIKDKDGKWVGIPTIQGEPGPRGIPGKDGRDGVDGKNGINGKTPVKGVDYFTKEDKQEFIDEITEKHDKDIIDIESYLDILTPKATAKGELVHVNDALQLATFENKIDGNVEQETTEGYNLIGLPDVEETTIRGLTFSIKNGLLKLNGTATVLVPLGNVLFNNLKETNKYRLQIFPQSGTWDNGWIGARGYIDGTQKWYQQIAKTDNTNYVVKTLTVEELENNNRCDMYVANGSSFNNFSCYVLFKKGEEYANYEPYTGGQASPNPEYPQEIEVLEGYNLFDKNNANILYDTYIGTAGNVGSSPTNNILYLEIKPNTSYTIQKISSNRFRVGTYNSLDVVGKTLNNIITNLNDSITSYTLKNTTDKYLFFQYLGGDKNEQEILDSIIINEGTDKKPYLPYGCVGYKVVGKNRLNMSLTQERYEVKLNKIENEKIYLNVTGQSPSLLIKQYIPKGKYKVKKSEAIKGSVAFKSSTDETIGDVGGLLDTEKVIEFSKDINSIVIYLNASYYDTSKEHILDFNSLVMVNENDNTEYEPYKKQIVPLDLKGNFVGKLSDSIKDYLVTDKKKYWLVKNVGKWVLTGEENITLERINDYGIANFFVPCKDITINFICNYFVYQETLIAQTNTEGMLYTNNGPYIRIKSDVASTVDEFKQWLSENNVEVYYQLAKPDIIYLGELPEPIKTFEGTNNIQLLANLDTEIEVKYALDLQKKYDNKIASLSNEII